MQEFIQTIQAAIAEQTGLELGAIKIESPRDPELGDLAFPCFPLARSLKLAPPKIAAELGPKLQAQLEGIEVTATGPYLNFKIQRELLASTILGAISEKGAAYGGSEEGAGKTIVIDFSSPNIAKPFHVGHLRSTIIGAAIKRTHELLGYRTVGINHIGDWGSQFGKLVAAIERWGAEYDLESEPIQSLLALYVRFHEEVESDPELAEQGREAFRELESGRPGKVRETWKRLTTLSMAEFDRVYKRLGIEFDHIRGEAFYEDFLESAVERVEQSGVTELSDGALVVMLDELEKNAPPCLLRKTDGTTLYATRDLAAMFHRWDEFAFERCLYVVGSDQRLHFRQLKNVLKRMQLPWEEAVQHVDFGMLRLPGGKLSTRKGQVVFLEDLLDRAVAEARKIIAEKNPNLESADAIAESVGLGAVIFHDLKKERIKDVVFEWEEVLSFEGETGPYVQYTHARLASIERKAASKDLGTQNPAYELLEDAAQLCLLLGRFPQVVESSARSAEPSEISRYVLELCREVNSWYAGHRVLGDDARLSSARLSLVCAVKIVIANGLRLLGMDAPAEM